MPPSLSHVKYSDSSRVIALSKRGADVDILLLEITGPMLHFHNWFNIRIIGIYQTYI